MTIYLYPDGFSVGLDGLVRSLPVDGAPNEESLGETISFQDDGSVLITGMTIPDGVEEVFLFITGTKDGVKVASVAQFPASGAEYIFTERAEFLGACDGASDLKYFACAKNSFGLGTAPRGPASEFGEAIELTPPEYLGGLSPIVVSAGEQLSWDWDAYFSGATSYTVTSGLTGGVSSDGNKTRDLYTVTSAVEEEVTINVTASNADGSASALFTVTVLAATVAPRLVTPLADAMVQIGGSLSRNVSGSFEGTDLLYSSDSGTALFRLSSDGVLRNTTALASPLASTTLAAQAESSLGAARSLAADPFDPTSSSATVTVAITSHGLSTNDWIAFSGVTPGSGLTISGFYEVASAPTADTITIDAGASASSGDAFGGDNVIAYIPVAPMAVLGSNPLARASGQAYLRVTATGHGLSTGNVVALRGVAAAMDLNLDALHSGAFYVFNVPDADTFDVIVSGSSHTTTGTGGGGNVTLYKPKMPAALGADPLAATNGSPVITLTLTGHGLQVGQRFALHGLSVVGGLNCNGHHIVSSVPNANSLTFVMGDTAAPTATGGGSAGVLSYRGHTIPVALGSNPFNFTSGQTTVTVHAPAHGLTVGKAVYLSGATAAAGVTPSGTYRVSSVPGPDDFTITTGAASSTVAGGGTAVIMHVPSPPALDHISVGVTAEKPAALSAVRFAPSFHRFPDYRTPRIRIPGEPIPLGVDPFKYTNGSKVIEVTLANHGLENDDAISLSDVGAAAGVTLNGAYTVTSVTSADAFTITHASNATANVTSGGGSNALIHFANPSATLASNPIATTSGSSSVTVTKTAHGLGPGRLVSFSGASAVGGLTLSGPYRIVSATANTFTVDAGSNAGSTATGGGAAVVMTTHHHNQVRFPGSNPIAISGSTVTVTMADNMLEVGRKIVVRGAPTVGGLNINGERTVATADSSGFTFTMPSSGSTVSGVGGSAIQILPRWEDMRWTRSTPDDEGVVAEAQTEYNVDETASRLYEVKMQEAGRNGDPNVQTVTQSLGADPLSVTQGEKIVTVSANGHGLLAGWLFRITGSNAVGGITLSTSNYTVLTASTNSFTFEQDTAATSTATGGGSSCVLRPQRRDYSVWATGDGTQSVRLSYLKTTTSLWSGWSGAWTVPDVTVGPTQPIGDALWTATSERRKRVYEGGTSGGKVYPPHPGNYGLQFQRTACWNQAKFNNANGEFGWIVSGQDQDTGKMSKDGGRSWGPLNVPGLFGSIPGGMWLDTDRDGLFFTVCHKFGSQPAPDFKQFCGLYVGTLDGVKRMDLTYSNGRQAFRSPQNGSTVSVRRQQQVCGARPQNAAGTLTYAQMPLYAFDVDVVRSTDSTINNIDLWQSLDNGATWSHLRSFDTATYAKDEFGVMWMEVAPNGDILFCGPRGAYVLEAETTGANAGVVLSSTAPKKIFPSSGDRNVSSITYINGSPTTASGCYLSVWIDTSTKTNGQKNTVNDNTNFNNGLYKSSNVRTTTPGRVSGTNLENNYAIWHLSRSPLNHDLLTVCGGQNQERYSTNGGVTFSNLATVIPYGETSYRMGLKPRKNGDGVGHVLFSPHEAKTAMAFTQQTVTWTDDFPTWKPEKAAFFDGGSSTGIGFHYRDWKGIVRTQTDSWVNTSYDGLAWQAENGRGTGDKAFIAEISTAADTATGTGISGANGLLGDARVISAAHTSGAGMKCIPVLLTNMKTGSSDYGHFDTHKLLKTGVANTSRMQSGAWSLKDPGGVGFLGRWAITGFYNTTPTLIDHEGHEYVGQAMLNGDTLITFWGDHSPGGGNNQTAVNLYRSTHDEGSNNQGAAWAQIKYENSSGAKVNDRALGVCIAVDPHHATRERVLYSPDSAPSEVWEVYKTGSTTTHNRLVDLWPKMQAWIDGKLGVSGAYLPKTQINGILVDPFRPGLIWAVFQGSGICNWWMSADNGTTWEPIQSNAPMTNYVQTAQHPYTGDVFGCNTLGEHTFAPHQKIDGYPNVDEIMFSGGSARIKPLQTLTKGGVTATVHAVIIDSGSWANNNAAGKIILVGRAGGSFTAGAATSAGGGVTSTGACNLTGAQTSIRGACTIQNQQFYDDINWHPPTFIV